MKKVLILVLSADFAPYGKMIETSMTTWESVEVEGCDTVFYCAESDKKNTNKIIYLPVREGLFSMGEKMIMALEWALKNKEFDYIARPHSSIYVNKAKLIEYVQTLPSENVFAGIRAESQNGFVYCWGGVGFLFSKDVAQKIVDNKCLYKKNYMEDESLSLLVEQLGIPFLSGNKVCSIDKREHDWQCTSYCGESLLFTNFADLKNSNHFFFRVKNDGDRSVDEYVMKQLFKVLN